MKRIALIIVVTVFGIISSNAQIDSGEYTEPAIITNSPHHQYSARVNRPENSKYR